MILVRIDHPCLRVRRHKLVLTIPSESASVAKPRVHTTLPKVEKADTSLAEAPTVLALVVQPGSKVSDDIPFNDDPNLLNFTTVASWISCLTSSLL
jgi:hypothetical protein